MVSLSPFRTVDRYVSVPVEHWWLIRYYIPSTGADDWTIQGEFNDTPYPEISPYGVLENSMDRNTPWNAIVRFLGSGTVRRDPILIAQQIFDNVHPQESNIGFTYFNLKAWFDYAVQAGTLPLHYHFMFYEGNYFEDGVEKNGQRIHVVDAKTARYEWFQTYSPDGFGTYVEGLEGWNGDLTTVTRQILEEWLHKLTHSPDYQPHMALPEIYSVTRYNDINIMLDFINNSLNNDPAALYPHWIQR